MTSSAATTINLQSLPDDILFNICSRVAEHNLSDLQNLQIVSRLLHKVCSGENFLRDHPSETSFPPLPDLADDQTVSSYTRMCTRHARAGNPVAMLHVGIHHIFRPDSGIDDIKHGYMCIRRSGDLGCRLAKYVKGIILLGSTKPATRHHGARYITSIMAPTIGEAFREFHKMRGILRDHFWRYWVAGRPMLHTLRGLNRDNNICHCDSFSIVERLRYPRIPTISVCQNCLVSMLVKPFFDLPF